MTVVAGDILRTSMNFSLADGTLYQNVYHHQRTGVGIFSDAAHVAALASWAETMYAELDDLVRLNVTEALSFVERVEFVVDEWVIAENIGTFLIAFTPTNSTEAYVNQVSPFVLFKTARPRTVGRKFLFPFCQDSYVENLLATPTVTAMVAYADDAVNNITLQVLDYLVPGVPRTGIDAWYPFEIAVVTDNPGSQRRRRIGQGA